MRKTTWWGIGAAFLLFSACEWSGTGPGGPSFFQAELAGEVTGSFYGAGSYYYARDHAESPYYFTVAAKGTDPEVRESFDIRWPVTVRPSEGSYRLVPFDHRYGSSTGVTAIYFWSRGDPVTAFSELYVASDGVVEITRSTRDAVEGTIRFTGIQTFRDGPDGPTRMDPRTSPDPTAPRIEVEGTFRVPRSEMPDGP
jgi:hypothetical protein